MTKPEDTPARVARGARVRELRERMDLTGPAFADRMTAAARELGLSVSYDRVKVSKIETGVRDLSLEDVAVIERIAPRGEGGWFRVAFGREKPPEPKVDVSAPSAGFKRPQKPYVPRSKGKDAG